MLQRIFGKSGSGKTRYIFSKLEECMSNQKKAFLIVPEQCAVSYEREVIEKLGNKSNLYIEVINFKRLCNRVFRETGTLSAKQLDSGAKKLIMAQVLDELLPLFSEFSKSAHNADFIDKAISGVNELKMYGISPEKLEETSNVLKNSGKQTISKKINELAIISSAFDARQKNITGVSADIYERLCDELEKTPFFNNYTVFVDSFYGFTYPEMKILSHIFEQADDVYVSFACDIREQDEIFDRCKNAAFECKKCAENHGVNVVDVSLAENIRHTKNNALYVFRDKFSSMFLATTQTDETCTGIQILSCRDIYSQARAAASVVSKLVRGGDKFSDIAICAKNVEEYYGVLDTVFAKSDIKLSFEKVHTLSETPLYELVLSGIEASFTFDEQAIMRFVKTGLSCLCDSEADIFETYVRTWGITSQNLRRDEDWLMNPDGYVESEPDMEILGLVNSARSKIFTCIDSLAQNLKTSKNVKDCAVAVWNFLNDIAKQKNLESFDDGADGRDLDLLCECLDSMVSSIGEDDCTPSRFAFLFKICAGQYDIGKIPESTDEIAFYSVDLMRTIGKKHVIIMGVNEGVFPCGKTDSGFFTESEKRILKGEGIVLSELAENKMLDELFLAYSCVCSAGQSVTMLYSETSLSGEKMYPSTLVSATANICGVQVHQFNENNCGEAYIGDKLLFESYLSMNNGVVKNTLHEFFKDKEKYREKLEYFSGTFNSDETLSQKTLSKLYGESISTSYSRLEKFNECPFAHFCTYTLRLRSEPVAKLGPPEAGNIMHRVLEQFVPILSKSKLDGKVLTPEQAKSKVCTLLEEFFKNISGTGEETFSKRFKYLYNRLSKQLCAMAEILSLELIHSEFLPSDFELTINDNCEVKPVKMQLGDGRTLKIVGQIDRVDVYEKDGVNYVRIIDYKTGSKVFRKEDILAGFNLQMLLYMYTLTQTGKVKYGDNIVPAGVLYANVTNPDTSENLGFDDEAVAEQNEVKASVYGVLLDETDVLNAMDNTEKRMFVPIRSDYLFSLSKLGELLNFASLTAAQLAMQMYSGHKKISPFVNDRIDACRFCDMLPVCQGAGVQNKRTGVDSHKSGTALFDWDSDK